MQAESLRELEGRERGVQDPLSRASRLLIHVGQRLEHLLTHWLEVGQDYGVQGASVDSQKRLSHKCRQDRQTDNQGESEKKRVSWMRASLFASHTPSRTHLRANELKSCSLLEHN